MKTSYMAVISAVIAIIIAISVSVTISNKNKAKDREIARITAEQDRVARATAQIKATAEAKAEAEARTEYLKNEEQKPRITATIELAKALKTTLRNPASLEWIAMMANQDGSLVCLRYRAQNGFGGLNISHIIFWNGRMVTDDWQWSDKCTGEPLIDMMHVKNSIP